MALPMPITDATYPVLDASLRGAFVLLMGLLALLLWQAGRSAVLRLAVALALGCAAYAVQSALLVGQAAPLPWQAPLQALMTGNPVVIALLAWALFDDSFSLRPWHAALWAGWVALGLANCYGWHHGGIGWLLEHGPLAFSALALWPMLRHWQADLVEPRRQLRWRILLAAVAYSVVSTLIGLPTLPAADRPTWLGALDAAALLALGLAVALPLLTMRQGLLAALGAPDRRPDDGHGHGHGHGDGFGATAAPALPVPDLAAARPGNRSLAEASDPARRQGLDRAPGQASSLAFGLDSGLESGLVKGEILGAAADASPDPSPDPAALSRLTRAMDQQQLFRREGLTIGQLAAELGLPEYRLRRVINQQLGHRNFNAFLNGHRIARARAALADPGQATTPVLAIAMDVGFQSLGPFNRAFKAATGLTPTEFRRQALGNGDAALAEA